MKLSNAIKPISYLKAHASEIIRDVVRNQKTLIVTHNGEAKVVVLDVKVYERQQETLAMLKILAQSSQSFRRGGFKPLRQAFATLKQRIREYEGL
ncbi:MAG TPA: type II toxin-antitoxin system Phd/YefM family antitoxin [Bacteroidota bacterium]|nr:type II toxin-antitoxin system Phd/YefM family antitoxin [Bacteroidota bacterium]